LEVDRIWSHTSRVAYNPTVVVVRGCCVRSSPAQARKDGKHSLGWIQEHWSIIDGFNDCHAILSYIQCKHCTCRFYCVEQIIEKGTEWWL